MPVKSVQGHVIWLPLIVVLSAIHHIAAQPQSGAATCQAVVSLSTNWVQTSNNVTFASININIVNKQATVVPVPWTLTLKDSAYGMVKQVILPATAHMCMHASWHA